MATRVSGVCYIRVNGTQYALRGNITVMGFTTVKEQIVGLDGVHGFREVPKAPSVSATFTNIRRGSAEFIALQNIGKSTVQENITVNAANGQVHTLYDVVVVNDPAYDPDSGEVSVEWSGSQLRTV